MAIVYTAEEILQMLQDARKEGIEVFYRQEFLNYRGKTADTNEYYTEIMARWCCENIRLFRQIPKITRASSYKMLSHRGKYDPNSPRKEECIAMQMFNFCRAEGGQYSHIGTVLDYQTPLNNKRKDSAGKIDLLAYDGACLRLLELKEPGTDETMLRCALEGYTYLETVDKEKLAEDFSLPAGTAVKACPFVFVGSQPYLEMQEERPHLRRLMELLDLKPYYIGQENGEFVVTEG